MFNPAIVVLACISAIVAMLGMRYETGTPTRSSPMFILFIGYMGFVALLGVLTFYENHDYIISLLQ